MSTAQRKKNNNRGRQYKTPSNKSSAEQSSRINASSLQRMTNFTLDATLGNVLLQVGGKIQVEINPGGTVVRVVNGSGNDVCPIADIQKIAGMNRFVNTAQKDALSSAALLKAQGVLFKIFVKERKNEKEKITLSTAMCAQIRALDVRLQILEANSVAWKENKHVTSTKEAKAYLSWAEISIRNAIYKQAIDVVRSTTVGKNQADYILAESVPQWVYKKLSAEKLANLSEVVVDDILFTKDPTKGIHVTRRELQSSSFMEANTWVLRGSKLLVEVLINDTFIKAYLGLKEDVVLSDDTNAIVKKINNVPLLLVRPDNTIKALAEALKTRKTGAWKWPVLSTTQNVESMIAALASSFSKVRFGCYRTNDMIGDFLSRFLEIDSLREKSLSNEYTVGHWLLEEDRVKKADLIFSSFLKVGKDYDLAKWYIETIQSELGIARSSPAGKILYHEIGLTEHGYGLSKTLPAKPMVDAVIDSDGKIVTAEIPAKPEQRIDVYTYGTWYTEEILVPEEPKDMWSSVVDNVDLDEEAFEKFLKRSFTGGPKKSRADEKERIAAIQTSLGPNSLLLKKKLQKASAPLAKSMESWLKSFVSQPIQEAIAGILVHRVKILVDDTNIKLDEDQDEDDDASEDDDDNTEDED